MINAILNGDLKKVEVTTDPIFGLQVPQSCPGVPDEVLDPRGTWKNPEAYDEKPRELAVQFIENFKEYQDTVGPEVIAAGPQLPTGKKPATKQIK
jgi:phosphoenolpyruvate carboxykinase (ATP)